MSLPDATLVRLPKAELHVHLDGSLRPATLLELALERGVDLPVDLDADPSGRSGAVATLARHMVVDDAASLEEYLERFDITLSVMQDAEALERIAYECVLDHVEDGVRYLELRFCPLLSTEGGLSPDDVVDATLAGLRRAEADARIEGTSIRSSLIVCGLRSHPSADTLAMAELAVAYAGRGVCGFDIAGAEAGHPVADHMDAFEAAARDGLPVTIHAGEGFGPASIRQALELGHARRIGHGVRLGEDPALQEEVRRRGVLLETCLTSNVQTRVVPKLAAHPAAAYLRAGIPISLSTDNRLMSGVSLVDEYRHARDALGLTADEIRRVARAGFEHAFGDDATRADLLATFDRDASRLD